MAKQIEKTYHDVQAGDVIMVQGYRVKVVAVERYMSWQWSDGIGIVVHCTLQSEPSKLFPAKLPPTYENMVHGAKATQKVTYAADAERKIRNAKARMSRAARRDAIESLGMREVRGALGGKYIE